MSYHNTKEQNESEWNERIRDFINSGMDRTEYCKKHDLSQQTFLSWLGRHFEKTSNLIPIKVTDKHTMAKPPLCELELNGLKVTVHDKSVLGEELSIVLKSLVSANAPSI
jgi:hypothetical protein